METQTAESTLVAHVAPIMAAEKSFEMTDAIAESIATYAVAKRPEWDADQIASTLQGGGRCWADAERTVAAADHIVNDPSVSDFSVIALKGPWWETSSKKI